MLSSAPEAAYFTSTPAQPAPETEVISPYSHVAEDLAIPPERAHELPQLCTALTRTHEHLIRAQHGLFPYDHPYTISELAQLYTTTEETIHSRLYRARHNLRLVAHNAAHATRQREGTATYTLELLAQLLSERSDILTDEQRDTVQALNGLPPYLPPRTTGELASAWQLPRKKISRIEQAALRALEHPEQTSGKKPTAKPRPTTDHRKTSPAKVARDTDHAETISLAKRIELGWYAAGIVMLTEAQDPQLIEEQLYTDAEAAAKARTVAANRRETSKRAPLTTNFKAPAPAEQRKPIIEKYSIPHECDTPNGRHLLLETARVRADSAVKDPEILQALREIIKDGTVAEEALLRNHFRLIAHVASRMHGEEDRAMEYGYEGLLRAVRGFDYSLGYSFSTYTVNWITFYMREGLRKEKGLPKRIADKIEVLRQAEAKLSQTKGGTAVHIAEIAAECSMSEEQVREYLGIHRRSRTLPFSSLTNIYDDGLPFEATIEAPPLLPTHTTPNTELRHMLKTTLREAQLTPRQLHAIRAYYGLLNGRVYDVQEIAAQLKCTPESAETLIDLAIERIQRKPHLATRFAKYVKRVQS